jgi:hypothetical protein
MATYNKFNVFTQDVVDGAHNFASHSFKVMLTNTLPVATNAVKADITDISAGNGYSAGGTASAVTLSNASGVEKAVFANVVFTASGGSIGPFRYAVWYNDTQTSPAKPLIGWADYGSAVTLATGETFTWTPDATNGLFTVT